MDVRSVRFTVACLCASLVATAVALVAAAPLPAGAAGATDYAAWATGLHDVKHYWRLNSSAGGTTSDAISAGAVLTVRDGSLGAAGVWGSGDGAASFGSASARGMDSVDGYTRETGSSASVDLWIKPSVLPAAVGSPAGPGRATIFDTADGDPAGHKSGLTLEVDTNGRLWGYAGFANSLATPAPSVPVVEVVSSTRVVAGSWYHLNLTWRQTGELELWVDTSKESFQTTPPQNLIWDWGGATGSGSRSNSGVFVGGSTAITGFETFQGTIDEVVMAGGMTAEDAMNGDDIVQGHEASGKPPGGIPVGDPRSLFGANGALKNGALCQVCVLDPINAGTGNLIETVPGISVAARGPGLSVDATYNSLGAATDAGMGFGWSNPLRMRLEKGLDRRLIVIQEDGSAVPFNLQYGGTWKAGPNFEATLTKSGTTYTYTRQRTERFTFDEPSEPTAAVPVTEGRLTAMSDLAGNTTTVNYPSAGSKQASSLQAAGNRKLDVTWTSGRVTRVQENLPGNTSAARWIGFGYDGAGDLRTYTDVWGGQWTFEYAAHRMTSMQKPRHAGTTTKVVNEYDAQGRVKAQTDELGHRSTLTYDYGGNQGWTLLTRPGGTGDRLDKFEDGRRVETIEGYRDPKAVTTTIEYADDGTNAVDSITVGGHKTVFVNNAAGYPTTSTDPTGRITRWTYEPNFPNLVKTETTGETTTSTSNTVTNVTNHDPSTGLITSTVLADGTAEAATTQYGRDPNHPDDVLTVTDAELGVWSSTYDPDTGQVLTSTTPPTTAAPSGATTGYRYDEVGRVETVTAPIGMASAAAHDHETSYSYDVAGRKTTVVGPTGDKSQTVLDADGNVWKQTERMTGSTGLTTTSTYDAVGRLDTVTHPPVGGQVKTEKYRYTERGQLETKENELGATWTYGYDAAGNLTSETSPPAGGSASGTVTGHGYDSAGRMTSTSLPGGGTISYGYDAAGRPTEVDYSDPATPDVMGTGVVGDPYEHGLNYDTFGRRIRARTVSPAGTETEAWGWNRRSELTSHTDVNGDATAYRWTKIGGVDRITYPGQTTPVERAFDAAGQLTTVKDFAGRTTSFDYDRNGNWITTKFGSTTSPANTDTMTYDASNRMESVVWAKAGVATPLGSETYTRPTTTAGMVTAITATQAAGSNRTFGYDDRSRLTSDTAATIGLDAASNVTRTADGRTQAFDLSQRLCWTSPTATSGTCASTPAGRTTYDYDRRGNRTKETAGTTVRSHTYDQANRLTAVSDATGVPGAQIVDMTDHVAVSGDYDGDSRDDVFFYRSSSTVNDDWVWWGADRPQFGASAKNYSVGSGYEPMSGDFNCDGKDDIFWYKRGATANNDYVWFWFGRGDTPTDGYKSKQFNLAGDYTAVAGDYDGDSCSDVFWYAPGTTADVLWWGDDDVDDTGTAFDMGLDTVSGLTYEPVAGDFDGNGTDDIFWYAPGPGSDALWLWTTGRTHSTYARTINTSSYDLAAGDVNGDGDDDLLFSNPDGADNIWWGGSEATFGPTNQKPVSLSAGVQPVFGDFDGDAKDDLFVYLKGSSGDTVWWGTSQANFGTSPVGMPAGATASSTYRYDSSGLRSGKSVTTSTSGEPSTATSTSSWDVSGGLPLLLRDKTGSDSTYVLYGPGGQPVEQIGPGGDALWLHRDQLGSVRLATDTTGTVVSARTWDAYGNPTTTTGTAKPLLGYAGQTTDPETGYQYLRARYYDPKTTQFLTLDPLVAQTGEPYGYTGANPISRTDPTGLCWGLSCPLIGGVSIGEAGGRLIDVAAATANSPTTAAMAAVNSATGGNCDWEKGATVVCYGGAISESAPENGAFVLGGVINTELSKAEYSNQNDGHLHRHETWHTRQFALMGPGAFLLAYGGAEFVAEQQSCSNTFELMAGLEDGGY